MNLKRAFGLAAAVALLSGIACVMPDQLSQIQKDVADVRQELRRVQEDQAQTLSRLEALENRSASAQDQVTRADLADLAVRIDQVGRETSISDERINDLGRRLDGLSQDVEQLRSSSRAPAPVVAPLPTEGGEENPPAGPTAQPDAEALYNTAYADFSKGNYALAVSGFEEYYEKFPDSALADNALYWIGECHFSQGSFPDAVSAFDRLLEQFPRSDKAAAANLKKGLAYLEQNQIGQAIVQLRFVYSTYPGSDEAKIARDKLTSLGAPL
jgi:tol-pal system protein YbgF